MTVPAGQRAQVKVPGERTREVTLDPGASADTPDKQIRVRQEPARADAGHPLHGAGRHQAASSGNREPSVHGLTRRLRTVARGTPAASSGRRGRPRRTACDPRAIADGESRSRTGSYGHPTVAGTKVLGKHLRWSEHYELVRKWWWSGTGSNCRPSAFQAGRRLAPRPSAAGSTASISHLSLGLPPQTPVPGSCAPCVITPHAHSAPPFADPPGDTPDPVSREDPDPWG